MDCLWELMLHGLSMGTNAAWIVYGNHVFISVSVLKCVCIISAWS